MKQIKLESIRRTAIAKEENDRDSQLFHFMCMLIDNGL